MNSYYINNYIEAKINITDLIIQSSVINEIFKNCEKYGIIGTTPPLLLIRDKNYFLVYGILENNSKTLSTFKYSYESKTTLNILDIEMQKIVEKILNLNNALIEFNSDTMLIMTEETHE